jgi:putative (di)nucleoside polyphosphate hydrolase
VRIDTAHPEFSAWKWVDADALAQWIAPFKRAVYEQVIKSFRAYLA